MGPTEICHLFISVVPIELGQSIPFSTDSRAVYQPRKNMIPPKFDKMLNVLQT